MYVQPSSDDDRLTSSQQAQFKQTACCLADSLDDLHHQALLNKSEQVTKDNMHTKSGLTA